MSNTSLLENTSVPKYRTLRNGLLQLPLHIPEELSGTP